MTRIGLISDTHGFLDPNVERHFADCDEIWHAGDIGPIAVAEQLTAMKPFKAVYGNIDNAALRTVYPEFLSFYCQEQKVLIAHIGGTPPKYAPGIRAKIISEKPGLFICGHSHILRIEYDKALNCLYMNPGAAGKHGWHKIKTIVKFAIDGLKILDCQVIELGKRGTI